MRILSLSTMILVVGVAFAGEQTAKKIAFTGKTGEQAKGWKADRTGKETAGSVWKLVEDKTAPGGGLALAQTASDAKQNFNLCIADEPKLKDVDLTVAFKSVKGEIDQGGGLVWRYKDKDNYYVARMNPLEDNFRLYKLVDGKRIQLDTKNVTAEAGKWHTLRVTMNGKQIKCYLNDKLYLEKEDDAFADAGLIGLWTKADAQTSFADLRVGR